MDDQSSLSIADMIRQAAKNLDEERKIVKPPESERTPKNSQIKIGNYTGASDGTAQLYPVMTYDAILAVTSQIKPSTRFRIQYKPDSIGDLPYLMGMERAGVVKVEMRDEIVLLAVIQSRQWEFERNRLFTLTATEKWSADWFVDRVARRVEAIHIIN